MELTKWNKEVSDNEEVLYLKAGFDNRILSVSYKEDTFVFTEMCDCYFCNEYNKEDALKLVDELRAWIIEK